VTKYLRKINVKKTRFILAYGLKGFIPWSYDSVPFRPVVRQNIMVRSTWESQAAHLIAARKVRGSGRRP
jgi:hypothetical protein